MSSVFSKAAVDEMIVKGVPVIIEVGTDSEAVFENSTVVLHKADKVEEVTEFCNKAGVEIKGYRVWGFKVLSPNEFEFDKDIE
jgi:hypothetical protein